MQLGNSNSLIDSIYYYLWYKDDSFKEGLQKIRIPDTIIFKYGQPQLWYFTSQKGDILIKKEESKTLEQILEKLCHDSYEGKVVAYFIYPEKYNYSADHHRQEYVMFNERKKNLQDLNVDERICIFYMTKELLVNFLKDNSKPPEGILQKFIEPYGVKETLIQAAWSPSVCILSRQQNYRFLQDKRYDPYERCVTFDGAEVFSRAVPIRGKEISQCVRNQVKTVVDKITNISYEKINISRVVMYFKSDKNNEMWFLYASCLRTQDEDKAKVAQYRKEHLQWKNNPCKKQNNTPIAMANNYAKPYNIKLLQTTNTIHPATLIKDILCFDCNELCQQQDLFETNFASIISTFAQAPDSDPLQNHNIPITQHDEAGKPPLISRVYIESTSDTDRRLQFLSSEKKQCFLRDLHSHIPPLLRKLYPNITLEVYENLRKNDRFLAKTIFLCQNCLLKYTQTNCEMTGASQKGKMNMKFFKRSIASKTNLMQIFEVKDIVAKMNKDLKEEKKKMTSRSQNSITISDTKRFSVKQPAPDQVPDLFKEDHFTYKSSQYNQSNYSSRTIKLYDNPAAKHNHSKKTSRESRPHTVITQTPHTLDSRDFNHSIEGFGSEKTTLKKGQDYMKYYIKISSDIEQDDNQIIRTTSAITKDNNRLK